MSPCVITGGFVFFLDAVALGVGDGGGVKCGAEWLPVCTNADIDKNNK